MTPEYQAALDQARMHMRIAENLAADAFAPLDITGPATSQRAFAIYSGIVELMRAHVLLMPFVAGPTVDVASDARFHIVTIADRARGWLEAETTFWAREKALNEIAAHSRKGSA